MMVTAKYIAEQLRISPATVDRVLHNRGGVSPKTVKKVLDKASELNYTPNKSASFLAKKKNLRIAFVFPEYPEYFWKQVESGIRATLEDIQDYGFHAELLKTSNNVEEQIEIVQEIINSDAYDGLVICPKDGNQLSKLINTKVEEGFPIYTFNNDSPLSKRLSYVGADYFDAGRLVGDLLDKMTGHSKKIAIITDEMDTFQMIQKKQGFEEYSSECNEKEIQQLKIDNNNIVDSIKQLEANFKELDGVYVACGALADVAKELKEMDKEHRPIVIGHDMNDEIYQYLIEEIVTATICQDPVYQGNLAVRTAFNHLMLEKPIENTENIVKLEIVTRGNAKYYHQNYYQ